jgi:hypothetical protein
MYDRPPEKPEKKSSFLAPTNMAIMAVILVVGISIGMIFSSTASFNPENVASREVIDRSAPNPELCASYGASAIAMDLRAFVTLNPFNVYISQPRMQPGCVLRSTNFAVLERSEKVDAEEVRDCRRRLNTFGYTGDLDDPNSNFRADCIYQNDSAQNLFLDRPGIGGPPRETDRF